MMSTVAVSTQLSETFKESFSSICSRTELRLTLFCGDMYLMKKYASVVLFCAKLQLRHKCSVDWRSFSYRFENSSLSLASSSQV